MWLRPDRPRSKLAIYVGRIREFNSAAEETFGYTPEEMTGRPLLNPAGVPEDVHPLTIRYVGSYALAFRWSDGHDTGIYSFHYLREICEAEVDSRQ